MEKGAHSILEKQGDGRIRIGLKVWLQHASYHCTVSAPLKYTATKIKHTKCGYHIRQEPNTTQIKQSQLCRKYKHSTYLITIQNGLRLLIHKQTETNNL